jgi:small-conductance mechanosensitive channel
VTIRVLLRTLPGKQFAVGREFRRRIKSRLDREGIEIPFPQRSLHIVQPRGGALAGPARPAAPGPDDDNE